MKLVLPLAIVCGFLPVLLSAAELVSKNAAGTDAGNMRSREADEESAQLIAGNRYLVFESNASDLGPVDTNGVSDIYLRDLQTGAVELISANSSNTDSGNNASFSAEISDDGRYVVFVSSASDLVGMDTNGDRDLFLRDRNTDTTRLITKNVGATDTANDGSSTFNMTPDGLWVVFASGASDLVATDSNAANDIFLYSTMSDSVSLVSINLGNTDTGNGGSEIEKPHVISHDGRYVVFSSFASDLIATDANGFRDVFLRDLVMGTTTRITENAMGVGYAGNSATAVISADGSRIVFETVAVGVTAEADTNATRDFFAYEVASGTTQMVTVNFSGTAAGTGGGEASDVRISDDGRFFGFESGKTDLVNLPDTNGERDAYIRDLVNGVTTLISTRADGAAAANGTSSNLQFNSDASVIVYFSEASDIVTLPDNNGMGTRDAFLYLRSTGQNYLISANSSGSGTANDKSENPIINADGSLIYFTSAASDIDAGIADTNMADDVYLARLDEIVPPAAASASNSGGGGGGSAIGPLWIGLLALIALSRRWQVPSRRRGTEQASDRESEGRGPGRSDERHCAGFPQRLG